MITKKAWLGVVLALGVAPAVLLCAVNGFVPGADDVVDPLGRPSQLSLEVINSADQFDTLTSILVPKHAQLSSDIQALNPLANDLEGLTDKAGELAGQAKTLNASTGDVSTIAAPLPDLVANVTGRANQASPTVAGLSTAVGSVTTQLEAINTGLTTIEGTLGTLGPKATAIAATLANVEEEARHVQELGPLLAVVGPPVNSLNLPPLGVATTPTP
ncbi:hypothetical protein WSS_A35913 [Rhodococcus opacus M213]|uniref:Uncharacterized protein n=2 Tax=Rhodococcus opacus M213 TaxID=1129896 RepID=K8XL21_RHOOP|nr:hypothetical protein [Rhodococcus opacus]EKT77775.1 hypothetical protein WSS_A35913 [Rhodococcus opacus M213]